MLLISAPDTEERSDELCFFSVLGTPCSDSAGSESGPAPLPAFWFGVLVFFGITPEGILFKEALQGAAPLLICGLAAVFSGAFLTPVALPYIPFRAFSLKGLLAGLLVMALLHGGTSLLQGVPSAMVAAGWLLCPAASSWFALQFTGAAPFTSMSGVQRELKYGLWLYIGAAVFILILMGIAKIQFFGGGV